MRSTLLSLLPIVHLALAAPQSTSSTHAAHTTSTTTSAASASSNTGVNLVQPDGGQVQIAANALGVTGYYHKGSKHIWFNVEEIQANAKTNIDDADLLVNGLVGVAEAGSELGSGSTDMSATTAQQAAFNASVDNEVNNLNLVDQQDAAETGFCVLNLTSAFTQGGDNAAPVPLNTIQICSSTTYRFVLTSWNPSTLSFNATFGHVVTTNLTTANQIKTTAIMFQCQYYGSTCYFESYNCDGSNTINSTYNADGSVTSTDTLTLANGTTITASGTSDGNSETYFESPYGNTTAEQLLDATLENENSCTYQAGSRTMFAPAPANWASDRMNTTQV